MLEFIYFMLFSMFEALAWVAITLAIFRFRFTHYWKPAIAICFFMNIISYLLRDKLDVGYISTVINIVFIAAFFYVFVKEISVIFSFVCSLVGMTIFTLIQAPIVIAFFGSLSKVGSSPGKGYIVQTITGVVVFSLAAIMYRRGYGLSFPLNRLRFKWEKISITVILVLVTTQFSWLLYMKEIYSVILLLLLALAFFVYFTFKKEAEDIDRKVSAIFGPKD